MNKYVISFALLCAGNSAFASTVSSDQLFFNNDTTAALTLYEGKESASYDGSSFSSSLTRNTSLLNLVLTEPANGKGNDGENQAVVSDVVSISWKIDGNSNNGQGQGEGQGDGKNNGNGNGQGSGKNLGHLSISFSSGNGLDKPSNSSYGTLSETESKSGNVFDLSSNPKLASFVTEYGLGKITIKSDVSHVPVPASVWLFGSALACLAGVFTRKRA